MIDWQKKINRRFPKLSVQIAYWCFYVAVIIEVAIVVVDKSDWINPIEGRLFQLTFLLFLTKFLLTKYTRREYVIIFLFGAVGLISYLITDRNEILRVVMFIAACKDIDMKKCLKIVLWLTFLGCITLILLSVTGVYGNAVLTQDFGRGGIETRYVLGMGHPNALQCMIWALTTLYLYLCGKKMIWYQYLLILAVNLGFFILTDSKTGFLAAVFVIVMVFCMTQFDKRERQKLLQTGMLVMIAVTVFSIGFSVLIAQKAYTVYNHDWYETSDSETMFFVRLNDALTGRIRTLTGTERWEGTISTWSLFSSPQNNYFFDMGWIRLFYWYGIIPGIIFVIVLFTLLIYFYKKRDYMSIALISAISLYNIVEAHVISVYLARNYLFFLIGAVWCGVAESLTCRKEGKCKERKDGSWND